MNKAYKITTKINDVGGYTIHSAPTAGKAKTQVVNALQEAYNNKATYAWITSCRRIPEYDPLAQKYNGCIAWQENGEHWQQDKGHWHENLR